MRNTSPAGIARGLTATYLASLIPAFVAGAIALTATAALAQQCDNCGGSGGNTTVYAPPGGPIESFTMVMAGNQLSGFGIVSGNSGIVQEPAWADPFCNPSPNGNTCPVSVIYNPSTNQTTVVYSGSSIYQNSGAGEYHFGYAMNGTGPHNIFVPLSGFWSVVKGSQQVSYASPLIAETCSCRATKDELVAIVFYQATFATTEAMVESWNTIEYPKAMKGQPTIKFANYGTQNVRISNTGIITGIKPPTDYAGWQTLTSMMNLANMPPPGASGSPFERLLKPPPKILKPTKYKGGDQVIYPARFVPARYVHQ